MVGGPVRWPLMPISSMRGAGYSYLGSSPTALRVKYQLIDAKHKLKRHSIQDEVSY